MNPNEAQNCPKCGEKPYKLLNYEEYRCSDCRCVFGCWLFNVSDWNAIRYVKPLSPAMQRCMDAVRDGGIKQHWCECETIGKVARDGRSTCAQCGGRDAYKKSPDRPQPKKARRMKENMCLAGSDRSEMPHTLEHDEMPTCERFGCRPVEPTPAAPEWEDIAIETDGRGLHYPAPRSGMPICHALAVSEPGFMGYVYANGHVSPLPAINQFVDGPICLPIAWRRSKKGGA